MTRPLILLSNDDGYDTRGLRSLREALLAFADVSVCAPQTNQSATSHSLSLHRPLRLVDHGDAIFSLDGTPADCIYVALRSETRVLPRKPDLVVSGMNHGLNLGVDVFYSGTVAAAREGAFRGIPAIAVSADVDADQPAAAKVAAQLAEKLIHLANRREAAQIAPLLNVNFPPGDRWPLRATVLGRRVYDDDIVFRHDPRGREYLWIGGSDVRHEEAPGSDTEAYDQGVASVTPLRLNGTDPDGRDLATETAASVQENEAS